MIHVIFYVKSPEKPGYEIEVEQVSSTSSNLAEQVEEKVLDKGVEAVKRARSRRRGISDATGEK